MTLSRSNVRAFLQWTAFILLASIAVWYAGSLDGRMIDVPEKPVVITQPQPMEKP